MTVCQKKRKCTILSGVHIGDGCVVGAGAVVTKDILPYSIVGGVPAKVIRKRFDDDTIEKLEKMKWWDWEWEYIYDAIPLLSCNKIDELFEFYHQYVEKR